MNQTSKKTITYIIEGIERKVNLSIFNNSKIQKKLLKRIRYDEELNLKDNIEFIKMENIFFDKIEDVKINRDTICILENCYNKNNKTWRNLNFYDGSFEIINPNFINKVIELHGTKDAILTFDKEDSYTIKSRPSWNYNVENIEINSNNSITELDIKSKKINIYGYYNLNKLQLFCKKLIIGREKELTKINLPSYLNIIETNELILNNTIITNNTNTILYIEFNKLIGNNFIIKSKGDILINEGLFSKPRNEQGYFEITMDDIVRKNFINTLKDLKNITNNLVKVKTEISIPEKFGEHLLKQMQVKNEQINKLQTEYDLLNQEYEAKKELKKSKTNKILVKTKIKNLR